MDQRQPNLFGRQAMRVEMRSIRHLLICVAAAHAYPPRYYDCGKAFVKIQSGKGTAPSGRRVFPTTWTIQENWEKEDAENLPPIGSLNFRCTKDDKCWFLPQNERRRRAKGISR
jgi:hypothetical protein